MIRMKNLAVNVPLHDLWLKHVVGINLSIHDVSCLMGDNVGNINLRNSHAADIELQDGVYYLCAIPFPDSCESNFHLAFGYCEGACLLYENNGISAVIENAERLHSLENHIDV